MNPRCPPRAVAARRIQARGDGVGARHDAGIIQHPRKAPIPVDGDRVGKSFSRCVQELEPDERRMLEQKPPGPVVGTRAEQATELGIHHPLDAGPRAAE